MRKILSVLFFITLVGAFQSYSQNSELISTEFTQNGEVKSFDHIVINHLPLKFSLIDETIQGEWRIEIKNNEGKSIYADLESVGRGYCVFNPSTTNINWNNIPRKYDRSLNRDLYEIGVVFCSEYGFVDVKYLKLGLLPSRPQISDVIFNIDAYDWEYDMIYPYGNLSFTIKSDGAQNFYYHTSHSFLFPTNDFFVAFTYRVEGQDEANVSYDADWGEYICVSAGNEFGYVNGDTIFTTDYIKDEAILARIEELKNQAGIHVPNMDGVMQPPTWNNNTLFFNEEVKRVCVYNMMGVLITQGQGLSSMDLSQVSSGVYCVVYEGYDRKQDKLKIVKR